MKRNVELLFVRRMLENMLDQGEMDQVMEMSRRIDAEMQARILREKSQEAATM